ncbi:hypothetical protein Tco_0898816 [Tanacetum coccineum]
MLVDALLQHEVEGRVNKMVEKVRGLEIKQEVAEVAKEVVEVAKEVAEVAKEVVEMAKKVIRVVKEVVEVTEQMEEGNVRTVNNSRGGYSYREFMACNPKDYDGKGGAIVYTRWIVKMESVQDMSGCGVNQKVQTRGREATVGMTWEDFKTLTREELFPNNEMQKLETEFWCHAMVRVGHVAYSNRIHELARLVPHLVTLENKTIKRYIYGLAPHIRAMVAATKPTTIQSVILKAGMLTNEAIRNGALKKVTEKRWNNEKPSRD